MSEEQSKNLGNLRPNKGSSKNRKRLGRGIGSKWGKTAGKGMKGQKARKGGGVAPGFEGGQMPLIKRVPKRGFTNNFRKIFAPVNLNRLKKFTAGAEVNIDTLKDAGIVPRSATRVKLLANGEVDASLNVSVDKASESAVKAIQAAGGTIQIIPEKKKFLRGAKA